MILKSRLFNNPPRDMRHKRSKPPLWPEFFSCFKEGLPFSTLLQDILTGLVVGVVALPLAMAFAIGSGLDPARGLYTAIIAGFIVGILGGSRFQIAGPTGAFVVVVFDIVQRQGYEGLVIAMLMAGVMLIAMGFMRFGAFLRYIPYPVVTGMTSGIAVVLFTTQVKDLFGLKGTTSSVAFFERWSSYLGQFHTVNFWAVGLSILVIALIVVLRRINNRIPGAIIAVIVATFLAFWMTFPVETIETRFGAIPSSLQWPSWPVFSFERVRELMPDAITIALLAGIESLLSAVVADSIMGTRHRSDMELVAQGFGNIGSALFGGIPVTGAIARTATNCRLGAKTPISAITHAVVLLVILYGLSTLAAKIPLAALAAIVALIAWTMFEFHSVMAIVRSSLGDALLLLTTFVLTILIDITIAVEIGVLLAALIFMKKMAETTFMDKKMVKEKVEVVSVRGPLFFAVTEILDEHPAGEAIVLNMHEMALIDTTGIQALKRFANQCKKRGQKLVLAGANPLILDLLENARFFTHFSRGNVVEKEGSAIALAEQLAREV